MTEYGNANELKHMSPQEKNTFLRMEMLRWITAIQGTTKLIEIEVGALDTALLPDDFMTWIATLQESTANLDALRHILYEPDDS